MTTENPRYLALMVLSDNEKTRIPLNRTIDSYAKEFNRLSKRDRALANTIIYGSLRYRGKLDWIISSFSTRKIDTLEPAILNLLRMGLFQIIFLDKIPISAAVNTSVEMAKKISNKGAAGLVNAVLRRSGTQYPTLVLPDIKKSPALFIAVEKSIPLWLAQRWIKRFSLNKTLKLTDAINEIPPITMRTNTLKITREALFRDLADEAGTVTLTKYAENGISLSRPLTAVHEMKAFKKGYFQVQDEAAQMVTSILAPKPGESILDMCAGLGGKTGHIGQLMENRGSITALDVDKNKLLSLEKEMKRLGITIVSTKQMDILNDKKSNTGENNSEKGVKRKENYFSRQLFNRVLLDAPCTGLGVLKRNPDARWTRSLKDIKRLAQKQRALLLEAGDHVKSGGILVYSVCSCEPEENEEVINYFLEKRPDFTTNHDTASIHDHFHRTIISEISEISENGFFRTYPDNPVMDGFFAVSMTRK